jgi:hypothetical protein
MEGVLFSRQWPRFLEGLVATAFADLREIVGGDREILELKHGARQCIVTKTRGTFTPETLEGFDPILARAGQRMEQRFRDVHEESLVWSEVYRTRTYDLQTTRRHLISLREQWKHACDLVDVERTVRMNLEFDFKRRLVSPSDYDGMLAANTRPWPDFRDSTHDSRNSAVSRSCNRLILRWGAA